MFTCGVCGANSFRNEAVTEVFDVDGRRVLVEKIPAQVCTHCGEISFRSETAEIVRRIAHSKIQELDVLERADAMMARLVEQNARYDEEEVAADVAAAVEEVRSGHDG